jgi:hypothetical protein
MLICNQAELSADLDAEADACCFRVLPLPYAVPALSREAALLLILLLAVLTLRRLRVAR